MNHVNLLASVRAVPVSSVAVDSASGSLPVVAHSTISATSSAVDWRQK